MKSATLKTIVFLSTMIIALFMSSCAAKEDNSNTIELYKACMNSEYRTIKTLLEEKDISMDNCKLAEENDGDKRILDAVINATSIIDVQTCKLLLEGGAELNGRDEFGATYLHELIDLNSMGNGQSIELLNMMIAAGIDLNLKGKNEYSGTAFDYLMEQSPIMCKDFNAMCSLFVDNNEDLDVKILKEALKNEARIEAAPIILEALERRNIAIEGISPLLIEVIKGGDTERIIRLIDEKNYKNQEMSNIVIFAAAYCDIDVLKTLKSNGFDLYSHIGENEISALDAASAYNDESTIDYLVGQGLDINESRSNYDKEKGESKHINGVMQVFESLSYTPISYALANGKNDNVKALIENGAEFQENSWCIACIYGNDVSIDILLEHDFERKEEYLYNAYLYSDKDTVNYMLKKGISYDVSEYGETLMENISNNEYTKPLKSLIESYE